jgi:heme-degrading monooxygenase HmoA
MKKRSADAILRAYCFWIFTPLREECREYLEANTLKELTESPGNLRTTALFRDLDDGSTEVMIVALWDSMDSVTAFIGKESLSKPRIDSAVRAKIFDREPYVRQYTLSEPGALALIPPGWK